jgi:hypothetical protein
MNVVINYNVNCPSIFQVWILTHFNRMTYQVGLFYHYHYSISEGVLYSILDTCHLYEGFRKIRSQ